MTPAPRQRLRDHFGAGWLDDPADCLAYAYDNSRRSVLPLGVALAQEEAQIEALLQLCREHRLPLTVRGRGTNTTGASVPAQGGVVLSLERMDRVLHLSPGDRLLRAQAGCLNGEVQKAAGAAGLFWPPDPTSAGFSTLGGNLACGAGGPRAVKYGTAREHVLGLRALAGSGQWLQTGCNTSKGVVGYDLTRLLVGSEGTLAIITEATLRLLPRPEAQRTLRAAYRDVDSAAQAVARLMAQPATPSSLEFMDEQAVALAQAWKDTGVPAGTGALLLLEVDGSAETLDAQTRAVERAARGEGLIEWRAAASEAEAETLWACRKALSPSLRRLAPKKVNEDVAVPVTQLPALIAGLRRLSQRHGIRIVNFGHAGNGNIHVNLLGDPEDPAQLKALDACLHEVFRLVLDLGGTISGEHGVGLAKRDYVAWEIPAPTLDLMRQIKAVFDPLGLLNPGKTLPPA